MLVTQSKNLGTPPGSVAYEVTASCKRSPAEVMVLSYQNR